MFTYLKASLWFCISKGNCKNACSFENNPVCGSNGQTYPNQCSLSIATCNDPRVKFRHWGKCGKLKYNIITFKQSLMKL